jgi:HK97 gp10 family phage protein
MTASTPSAFSSSARRAKLLGGSRTLPPARRWHFVELGTARLPPKSFARRALDENAEGVLAVMGDELEKILRKVARS